MYINYIWDSSVTSNPNANQIEHAAQLAAQFFESTFSNPITINIQFGYGEVNGKSITNPNALAQSQTTYVGGGPGEPAPFVTYDQLKNARQSHAQTLIDQVAVGTLPSDNPTGDGNVFFDYSISRAEAKALGLLDPNSTTIDGYTGLSSSAAWDFLTNDASGNPNYTVTSNTNDAVAVIEHEISEILGRVQFLGMGDCAPCKPPPAYPHQLPRGTIACRSSRSCPSRTKARHLNTSKRCSGPMARSARTAG
jgi:hypothetical protein